LCHFDTGSIKTDRMFTLTGNCVIIVHRNITHKLTSKKLIIKLLDRQCAGYWLERNSNIYRPVFPTFFFAKDNLPFGFFTSDYLNIKN
jgi:hypothetical protein